MKYCCYFFMECFENMDISKLIIYKIITITILMNLTKEQISLWTKIELLLVANYLFI